MTTLKVFDTIDPREGYEIGEAATPEAALALLTSYYKGGGEVQLCGVTTADYDDGCYGEVYVPRLEGINA